MFKLLSQVVILLISLNEYIYIKTVQAKGYAADFGYMIRAFSISKFDEVLSLNYEVGVIF